MQLSLPVLSGARDYSALFRLLEVGSLAPVPSIAAEVLGHRPSEGAVTRWSGHGRAGVKLPTLRGVRRKRYTTAACFRAWLELTSGTAPTAEAAAQAVPASDPAADAILASMSPRLGRRKEA